MVSDMSHTPYQCYLIRVTLNEHTFLSRCTLMQLSTHDHEAIGRLSILTQHPQPWEKGKWHITKWPSGVERKKKNKEEKWVRLSGEIQKLYSKLSPHFIIRSKIMSERCKLTCRTTKPGLKPENWFFISATSFFSRSFTCLDIKWRMALHLTKGYLKLLFDLK